jgi:hypothetical protein
MRQILTGLLLAFAVPVMHAGERVASATVKDWSYRPLTGSERWDLYWRGSFANPGVFFASAGPALGAQMSNEPTEWGQGMKGYGRRLANRWGQMTVQNSVEAATAAALGHEVRYVRSSKSGFLPRAGHALAMNFVTYDSTGALTPHVARLGGAFTAAYVANSWLPKGDRSAGETARSAGMQIGISSLFNLVREFSPEIKRAFRRK